MHIFYCFIFITCVILKVLAVPPPVCRAEFRWDDCGKPPKAVMYYWKQGSRCEIGIWKGCLPNPNMFADEYECINTCVFLDRPSVRTESEEPETRAPTTVSNDTDTGTGAGNVTDTSGDGGDTTGDTTGDVTGDSNANESSVVTDATGSGGNGTEVNDATTGGDAAATDASASTEGEATTAAAETTAE